MVSVRGMEAGSGAGRTAGADGRCTGTASAITAAFSPHAAGGALLDLDLSRQSRMAAEILTIP